MCQLLYAGAQACHPDGQGWTALHQVASDPRVGVRIAELLLDDEVATAVASKENALGQTPLHVAVGAGNLGVAQLLLENGADVRAQDKSKREPMHMLCSSLRKDVTEAACPAAEGQQGIGS